MRSRRSVASCAACAAALALAVGACGSSDKSSSSSSGGGSSTATGSPPSKSTVKLGMINSTGAFVSSPDANAGAQAAVRAINARGGLAGHKLELEICNDKGDPTLAATCAHRMISDKVAAIVSGIGLNDQNSQPILEPSGIPEILARAGSSNALNSDHVYLIAGGTTFSYPVQADYLVKKLNLKYSYMITDSPNAVVLKKNTLATFKRNGTDPVAQVMVAPNQADFAPIVAAADKGGSQAALAVIPFQQVPLFARAAAAAGSPFKYITSNTIYSTKDVSSFGGADALSKIISVVPFPPLTADIPGVKQFLADMKAEQDAGDSNAAVDAQNGNGIAAWLCLIALEEALKQTNSSDVSSAGINTAMRAAKDLTMQGVIPPWTPDKAGPTGLGRLSNDAYYVIGYKAGQPYLITPKAITQAQAAAAQFG